MTRKQTLKNAQQDLDCALTKTQALKAGLAIAAIKNTNWRSCSVTGCNVMANKAYTRISDAGYKVYHLACHMVAKRDWKGLWMLANVNN